MKRWIRVALGALAMAGFAHFALAGPEPGTGFLGSEHDGTLHSTTKGACTNCHTPHQGKTTLLLWNHTLSVNSFSWDEPKTTAGTNFPTFAGDTYKGMSAKCLSCHDGSVAVTDGQWFEEEFLPPGSFKVPFPYQVGFEGKMNGTHPVAMPYPANGAGSTYNGSTTGSAINLSEWVPDPMATNGIRLYNDDGAGNIVAGVVTGKSGIECGSCHDVHNGPDVTGIFLLRGTTGGADTSKGGYICVQCHRK